MEKTKIIFCCCDENSPAELEAFANTKNQIFISIDHDDYPSSCIVLNRETAIKFVKHLKREISYLDGE